MIVSIVLYVLILHGSPIPLYVPLCTLYAALFLYFIALIGFEWGRITREDEEDD